MARCNGATGVCTRASGKEDYPTAKVSEFINSQAVSRPRGRNLDSDILKTTF